MEKKRERYEYRKREMERDGDIDLSIYIYISMCIYGERGGSEEDEITWQAYSNMVR